MENYKQLISLKISNKRKKPASNPGTTTQKKKIQGKYLARSIFSLSTSAGIAVMGTECDLLSNIVDMLGYDEGFSEKPYKGTEGFWHIGFGFCLDPTKTPNMTESVARLWMVEIVRDISKKIAASHRNHIYRELNTDIKCAIINMCYQMGVDGCLDFIDMWDCLGNDDYEGAAEAALDSLWAREQTPSRALRISGVIKTGTLDGYQDNQS